MAIKGFHESSIATSTVWNKLNTMDPKHPMQQKAVQLIKGDAKELTNEDIQAAYVAVKQISDTLTIASIKAFDNQIVRLLYTANQSKAMNQAIPFLTFKSQGNYVTYIFTNRNYVSDKGGSYSIQAPTFRDLITGATVANGIRRNYDKMTASTYLQQTLMTIYCAFVYRILNREYSIMTEKDAFDKIQFWISKFFLLQVFGVTDSPENINKMASSRVRYLDNIGLQEAIDVYDHANVTTINDLLELMRTQIGRMKSLNLGTFLSDWIDYYHVQAMLAVDTIEYLVFMVLCLLSGNNIINIAAADIVKETRNINQLRGELLKLVPIQ